MGPENKVRNTSNTHSHEHTHHPLTHTTTRRPNHPPTHQPTHPRRATAIEKGTAAAVDALTQTEKPSCCDTGISIFYDSPPSRGTSDPSPGGPFNTPRSPSWSRHPLFSGNREGLLCRWEVAGRRGRGRTKGGRESQLFLGYVTTKMFSRSIWISSSLLPRSTVL